jgi:hypothetical protein
MFIVRARVFWCCREIPIKGGLPVLAARYHQTSFTDYSSMQSSRREKVPQRRYLVLISGKVTTETALRFSSLFVRDWRSNAVQPPPGLIFYRLAQERIRPRMPTGSPGAPKVLVVEDEMVLRMRAVDIVEDAGFCPAEAGRVDLDFKPTVLSTH